MNQQNRVALITGANKGIGFETARQLGKLGTTVLLGSRDAAKGEQAAAKLLLEGVDAQPLKLDVTDSGDRDRARNGIEKQFGKLDILVNNAGIALEGWGVNDTSSVSQEVLKETFETNLFGPVALTQELLPLLRKSPAARIVNVSSIMGSLGLHADPGSPIYNSKPLAYDAAKTALNAFTLHLAHELRDTGIKVNSAHPGWVKTKIGGPDATMELEEGAKTSVILATLPPDGPTGTYVHLDEPLPW
jgi:NAD(P)-dependent dehydrogenase (short-subunit alcohol dehydrogenase family)